MSDQVKIAMVGCGGFAEHKTQDAIEQCARLKVVACYDVNPAPAAKVAARFGARLCDSYEQVLAMDEVEGVVLTTPNHIHRPQAEAAAAAGKHVFVEKPIANTVADGVAMTLAARKAGRILMVGHNTRRGGAMRLVAKYLQDGRLGQFLGCESQHSHLGGLQLSEDQWRADPAKAPGLPLMQLGIHGIDALNMLMGRPQDVAAFHRRAVLKRNTDCTVTIIAYPEPLTATLTSHYVAPAQFWLRAIGTAGSIELTEGYGRFTFKPARGEPEISLFPKNTSYAEEFATFARGIGDGEPVETDGEGGVYALAVVEASIVSARERRFVRIDELVKGL